MDDGSMHMGTCISYFNCSIDLKGEVTFDVVADAACEWTFKGYYA